MSDIKIKIVISVTIPESCILNFKISQLEGTKIRVFTKFPGLKIRLDGMQFTECASFHKDLLINEKRILNLLWIFYLILM